MNSKSTLNFLCQRIDVPNVEKACRATIEWFDIVQTSAPKSTIFLVFTQVDRIPDSEERAEKIRRLNDQLKSLLQDRFQMEEGNMNETD